MITAQPGMGRLLREALGQAGMLPGGHDNDGRADIVTLEARSTPASPLAEDVFVVISRVTAIPRHPARLAAALVPADELERALSVYATRRRRLHPVMRCRVITRLRDEHSFLRTELRSAVQHRLHELRPRWQEADPAELELWSTQLSDGSFISALRLTTARDRLPGGRGDERAGALRPSVAAAMVWLAGTPEAMLDPCCGTGTILRVAADAGWTCNGSDIDPAAVAIAATTAPAAQLAVADVAELPNDTASVDAVISNLPFGHRFTLSEGWHTRALPELARVVRPGGQLVLLTPDLPEMRRAAAAAGLSPRRSHPLELLGRTTSIVHYVR